MTSARFLTKLQVEDVDGERWVLLSPLVFMYEKWYYVAPAGFTTDLASIPRIVFWRTKSGPYNEAAVIHDACYQGAIAAYPMKQLTRADADALFKVGMEVLGVGWWSRNVMYRAVRLFGVARWHGNKETV